MSSKYVIHKHKDQDHYIMTQADLVLLKFKIENDRAVVIWRYHGVDKKTEAMLVNNINFKFIPDLNKK